jgi:hypothetical protein
VVLSPEQVIEAICPDLSGSPSLPVYLEMAAERTDRGFFGTLYNQALAYMACHLFTLYSDTGSGDGGAGSGIYPIQSKSEGKLSISYAIPSQSGTGETLGLTKYGLMYDRLIKSRPKMGVNTLGSFQ